MCLIIGKPEGAKLPKGKDLRTFFHNHPDGFGVSFQYEDTVRTIKGAMAASDMFALLDKVRKAIFPKRIEDIDLVMQWRRAVTGSICEKYCHPFPVTSIQQELDSLDVTSKLALAHNGVIWDYSVKSKKFSSHSPIADINDAQEFIKDYIVHLGRSLFNRTVQHLIESYTDSKFAILSTRKIYYIGDFEEENGCFYSNMFHTYGNGAYGGGWGDDENPYGDKDLTGQMDGVGIGIGMHCELCTEYASRIYYYEDLWICPTCLYALTGKMPSQLRFEKAAYETP